MSIYGNHEHFINDAALRVHEANAKWWVNLETGEPLQRNIGEMLMLVTSELAEALEGHRKSLMDSHLPTRTALEVELADALIRLLDVAAGLHLDLGGAFEEKMAYNAVRADHKIEARLAASGNKY
jgi:NTP pyrophosphatase (non-canonical NTP hydrolase)